MKTRDTTAMKLVRMSGLMIGKSAKQRANGALRIVLFGAMTMSLGACASGGGESPFGSSVFVDPSKYDLYNCQQLATARTATNNRVVELEGLMAKAETGAGGALVSGLAYQTDYRASRAQRDAIDEKMARNNCSAELAAPSAPATPTAPAGRRRR